MKETPSSPPPENTVTATVWFSVLMHAHAKPNHQEAAKALTELKRLGIVVKFQRAPRGVKGGAHG